MKLEDIFKGKKNEISFSIKPKISTEKFSEFNQYLNQMNEMVSNSRS